jgi:predicted DsbA family dithiol-disulfide isomerase
MALFTAYFTDGKAVADHQVLLDAVDAAGLDREAAAAVLAGDSFAEEVRGEENYWRREGISAVPAVIINGKYMISGGHPAASFEKALRRIAAEG